MLCLQFSVDPSSVLAGVGPLLGAPDPQQDVGEHVLVQTEAQPAWQVQQGDQPHHIVGVVGVVPGAGVKLPEQQAPAELPGVDEADVDGEPAAGAPASAEVQVEVELLHHEAAAAVHQEGPHGRVSTQAPVRFLHQAEHWCEKHLVQEAVHPKEEEARKARQGQGPPTATLLSLRMVPELGEPSVEHMAEVESQDVVHGQLRARHQPHLLGQSVDVADKDLEPDVDGRVEDEVKHRRPANEAPLLGVDLLQCKVGHRVQNTKVQRGKAHQFRVPVLQQPPERGEQDIQSHAVHPVEVEPHPWRQRLLRVLAPCSPARLRGISAHDQSVSAGSFAGRHPPHYCVLCCGWKRLLHFTYGAAAAFTSSLEKAAPECGWFLPAKLLSLCGGSPPANTACFRDSTIHVFLTLSAATKILIDYCNCLFKRVLSPLSSILCLRSRARPRWPELIPQDLYNIKLINAEMDK